MEESRQDVARAIAENATAALFMVGTDGVCTYANPAAERMTGYTAGELQGRSLHDLLHHTRPDGTPNPKDTCPLERALADTERLSDYAATFVRKDGTFFSVSCTASPIVQEGVRTGTVFEVRDTTEERRAREAQERYRLIARVANDAIWDWDLATGRLEWNEGVETLFGYTLEEIPQTVEWWEEHVAEEDRKRVVDSVEAALASTGDTWSGEYRFVRKDGRIATIIDRGHIARDANGRAVRMIGAMLDLSERRRHEEVLRSSEERYRSLIEATAAIVWNTTASGELLGEQPGWSGFTGQTVDEYAGTGWLTAIAPADREPTIACWRGALERRDRYEMEHRVRRYDGEYRDMVVRAVPILDASGNVREWVGVHSDVTRERELQRQVENERTRLRELFVRAPAFIAVLSGPDHVFDFVNPHYEALIGHRDVVGKPVREALPEVLTQGFLEMLDRVYETGQPFTGSSMRLVLIRNGQPKESFVNFVCEPFYTDGVVTGIFVHGNDVTALVHAREEAEYHSRLTATITDNAASCLFMMDERGHPTFMNPAAVEVTGYTLEEIRNAPLHEAVHHRHPDGRPYPMSDCPIDNGREQLVPLKDYRDVFVRKDGTFFPVSCYVAPLEREGKTIGAVLEFRDITDELHAQEALREADRRKDEFLATLSHELRTPLTAILGWSRLLQLGWNDEATLHNAIDTIEKSARVQAQIVDDVLDLSRIVSGKIHVESETTDVALVAANALDGIRLAAAAKEITLHSNVAEVRDEALILGDANRLQQVIWNLLTNAIKFTPHGGRVTLIVEAGRETVSMCVSDTGIGIRPDFLPHVFETFRQAESASTRAYGGLGLGLSIVRHLVQLHGGTVRAQSDGPGCGATFIVELPRLRQPRISAVTNVMPPDDTLADLSGVSVLVLDDEKAVRDYMAAVVARCGAAVRTATDVQQAIWLVQDALPDVVLCDLAMPHADGFAFLQWLRSVPWPRAVPVIAVTAYARPEDEERALAAGFDGFLRKPLQPGELSQAVAALRKNVV